MDSQIIFSGLCLFLNVKNNNAEMGEPAVVGVGTAGHQGQEHAHHEKHYPFIAFNVDKTDLHAEPAVALKTDDKAKRWRFITLDDLQPPGCVQIEIKGNPPATPTVDHSYDEKVAARDKYWPGAINDFNRQLVPKKGDKPDKNAAAFYMPLGAGKIAAGNTLKNEWAFPGATVDGKPYQKKWAHEVIYSEFPHEANAVTIILKTLDDKVIHTLRFTPTPHGRVTLCIGNNIQEDLHNAVLRTTPTRPGVKVAKHFAMLNQSASIPGGPLPEFVPPPDGSDDGGGGADGYCGPVNPNGG